MINQNLVHILGAGSIGQLTACYLRQAHVPVALLASNAPSANRLRDGGSKISLERTGTAMSYQPNLIVMPSRSDTPTFETFSVEIQCCQTWDVAYEEMLPPISRLIVTTKANHAVQALQSVRPRLSDTCQILLLQNGVLGVYQEVYDKVGLFPTKCQRHKDLSTTFIWKKSRESIHILSFEAWCNE
jgi:2-dehydropantoate 2-reductase